jgi:hypothetical protein
MTALERTSGRQLELAVSEHHEKSYADRASTMVNQDVLSAPDPPSILLPLHARSPSHAVLLKTIVLNILKLASASSRCVLSACVGLSRRARREGGMGGLMTSAPF